jgi:hypothetical protein
VQLPGDSAGGVVLLRVPSIKALPEWRTDLEHRLAASRLADRPLVLVRVGSKSTARRGHP